MLSAVSTVPEGTYIELVKGLFRPQLPTAIMAVAYAVIATLVTSETPDRWLHSLGLMGSVAMALRLIVLLLLARELHDDLIDPDRTRLIERIFGIAYLSFAAIFGLFAARAIMVVGPEQQMLIVALLVGYAAGVAAGTSFRPWIGISAELLSVVPTIVAALWTASVTHWALAGLLAALLAGGIQSMMARYRTTTNGITMRRLFATLARSDGLTGLPNRLALVERFGTVARGKGDLGTIAVHCLDLDRFKPVNDHFGHPVGDLLLKAVSERIGRALRNPDFAARIGGDEFIVVQCDVAHSGEAELLARRIVRSLSEPYQIGHRALHIGASIGFALSSEHGDDLEALIEVADRALLDAKSHGGGFVAGSEIHDEIHAGVG